MTLPLFTGQKLMRGWGLLGRKLQNQCLTGQNVGESLMTSFMADPLALVVTYVCSSCNATTLI